jgi:hypothetical protein
MRVASTIKAGGVIPIAHTTSVFDLATVDNAIATKTNRTIPIADTTSVNGLAPGHYTHAIKGTGAPVTTADPASVDL